MANVLVIEADEALRATLCELLASEGGHEVESVEDAAEAAVLLSAAPLGNVVVLDLQIAMAFYRAAELLDFAGLSPLRGHAIVAVTTEIPKTLPRSLSALCELLGARIVWMPFDTDDLLDAVAAAEASVRWRGAEAAPDGGEGEAGEDRAAGVS